MDTIQSSRREEEFIEMVLTPNSKDFEFQMCANSLEKQELSLSSADELFYKGKLIPLNLLQNSISPPTLQITENQVEDEDEEDEFGTHIVSTSLKPWSKKIKLIKQFAFSQKLKSMKSFFTKTSYKSLKNPFGLIESSYTMESIIDSEMDNDNISFTCHRLSFSGVIKRHSTSKNSSSSSSNCSCSSSSFSMKSTNGFYEINLLKKGERVNLEAENSIEGAIAHCKKSQQKDCSKVKRPQSEVQTCVGDSASSEN